MAARNFTINPTYISDFACAKHNPLSINTFLTPTTNKTNKEMRYA